MAVKGKMEKVEKTEKAEKGKAPEAVISGSSLAVASFCCGTCVMVLEMAGSRVVAPYMGTSLIVWTSLIGIVMASLSLGYWLGGVVSDKRPYPKLLARIIGLAALSTALMALIANPLLSALSRSVPNVYVGSVIASVCLFALPSVLLAWSRPSSCGPPCTASARPGPPSAAFRRSPAPAAFWGPFSAALC